jgi:hypothetical protein
MTPWLVHELRTLGLEVVCLDARHARAALKMQINKTDQNDAEGLAQIVRTGWYRSVHVKSFESHRARALLGARIQLTGMATRLSNHIRGVLKTFGLLPGAMRGLPFDRKVEGLILDRSEVALIVRPMLVAWRQLREQIAVFDKAIRVLAKSNTACRLLMSVPGIGVLSALAYVSTVENPARFVRSRSVGAHLGLSRDRCEIEFCDGRQIVLSFHLFAALELRSYFLAHFDIEDLRGLDLFHNRFAPDPRWNPASLAVDNQFSNELERLEETYATSTGFMERATHLLLVARRRPAATKSESEPNFGRDTHFSRLA